MTVTARLTSKELGRRDLRSFISAAYTAAELATICIPRNTLTAIFSNVLSGVLAIFLVPSAIAQQTPAPNRVAEGRALALLACTGCHVVTPDQPFRPIFAGSPQPPDFRTIANKPNTSAESLRKYLTNLPAVPPLGPPQVMANPNLTSDELENVVAFIMSLRLRP